MRLSQFRVHTVAFEVRFDPAYFLFDTSGEVWQGVKTAYPSLKVVQAAPNKVVGILDGRYQLSVELERVVIEDFPTSWDLGSYITICGSILPNVLAHLQSLPIYTYRTASRLQARLSDQTRVLYRPPFARPDESAKWQAFRH